ncbi:hypothetical protein BB560_005795 [Smittium megazygosporum]|uniref:RCC1-like domain-containing protein n=1 Tax=Smittium megazygosporum TaxID=133381 RepID=A0A2T9YWJ0_9FUNG|nr:hypothetical protein BB560_005795 [Smittium megazygosporum]
MTTFKCPNLRKRKRADNESSPACIPDHNQVSNQKSKKGKNVKKIKPSFPGLSSTFKDDNTAKETRKTSIRPTVSEKVQESGDATINSNNNTTRQKRKRSVEIPTPRSTKLKLSTLHEQETKEKDFAVISFGNGDYGQLGLGTDTHQSESLQVIQALTKKKIVQICCTSYKSVALSADRTIWVWVQDNDQIFGSSETNFEPVELKDVEQTFIKLESCKSLLVGLRLDGFVYTMGGYQNLHGEMRYNRDSEVAQRFCKINELKGQFIIDIAIGENHCVALSSNGIVCCWGAGDQYQLGRRVLKRHWINALKPYKLGLKGIVSIGAGLHCSCAINSKGEVYTWGGSIFADMNSDLPPPETFIKMPTKIQCLEGVLVDTIKSSEKYAVVLSRSGELYLCGKWRFKKDQGCKDGSIPTVKAENSLVNQFRNIASGNEADRGKRISVVKVPQLANVVDFGIENSRIFAVCKNGALYHLEIEKESDPTESLYSYLFGISFKQIQYPNTNSIVNVSSGNKYTVALAEQYI